MSNWRWYAQVMLWLGLGLLTTKVAATRHPEWYTSLDWRNQPSVEAVNAVFSTIFWPVTALMVACVEVLPPEKPR